MLSRQPNNVVGCYVIIQAKVIDNGGSFAKRTSDMNCRITDKIVARLAFAGLCYSALTAFAVPDVRFMEETHSDLDAVRKWAEITTDAAEDEIDGIDFKFEPVPVGTDGGWTMPGHWPLLSRKKGDFEPGRKFDGSWGADPCAVVVEHGDGRWTMYLADVSRDYSDMAHSHVTERNGAVEVTVGFASRGYVRKGTPQKSGDVWVLRGIGGLDGAFAMVPRWYEAVGQRPPLRVATVPR